MANYYTIVTPEFCLKCSKAEADAINVELERPEQEDPDNYDIHGFTFEFWSEDKDKKPEDLKWDDPVEGFLGAEEVGSWGCLPEPALVLVGKLIERFGLPFLEMGAAFTCDKPRPGSHGGAFFRIYPDGHLEEPIITWPREVGALPEGSVLDTKTS